MIEWQTQECSSKRKVAIVAAGSWGNSQCVLRRSSEHFLPGFFPSWLSFRVTLQHCNCRFVVRNTCLECSREIEVSLRLFRVRRKWFSKRFKKTIPARKRVAGILRLGFKAKTITENAYGCEVNPSLYRRFFEKS